MVLGFTASTTELLDVTLCIFFFAMYSLVDLNNAKKITYFMLELTTILERIFCPFIHCISLIITLNSCRGTKNCLIVGWLPPDLYSKVPWSLEECKKFSELLLFSVSKTCSFFKMTSHTSLWGSTPFPVHVFRRGWPHPLAPGMGMWI